MLRLLNKQKSPFFITTRSLIKGGKCVPASPSPCNPKPKFGPPPLHCAEFLNGIKVHGYNPQGGTIGACTVMFHAGSRNEYDDSLGVTHFLRAGSSCSGAKYSGFMRSRYLQQQGAFITCNSNRQTISFTLRCPEPIFADVKFFLNDVAACCQYPDHELDEVRKIVRNDLEQRPPEQLVMDLVQKACFAGPLSNSIYCVEERINNINSKIINEFIDCNFKTKLCSVGSANVHWTETMKVASHICCNRNDPCYMESSPRGGYEFEDTGPGEDTYMAFAVPGSGTCDNRCLLAHAILAAALGLGNLTSGTHFWNRIPMDPVGSIFDCNDIYTNCRAFNISYIDTGCFGILIKTRPEQARCSAFKAVEFLYNIGSISCEQIEIGKKRLKVGAAITDDDCVLASESMALQAANNLVSHNAVKMGNFIDQVAPEEVMTVAKCIVEKICCGQMAYAVVGDVEAAPHDGELRCS